MHQSDLPSRERSNDGTSETAKIPIGVELTSAGMGSEAAEGIHGMSSDYREDSERSGIEAQSDHSESISGSRTNGVDARRSAFYEWLDSATIRALVDRSRELSAGERLILIKGLVPGLVEEIGLEQFRAFLAEIETKAQRFQEAVDHPGQGRACRATAGEELGGPTPAGHEHLPIAREPDRRGAREAERVIETELWARTEHEPRADPHG
jgi:hypothetical protein